MAELNPSVGALTLHTTRQGMAAKVGHDLTIGVTSWTGSLDRSGLALAIDATTLEVREGLGGLKPLTDKDRAEIKKNIDEKVLKVDRFAEIAFESDPLVVSGEAFPADGRLTLAGVTVPLRVPLEIRRDGESVVISGSVTIQQTAFGIKPYSGMMGALKVADDVEIRGEARIPASQWPF